MQVTYAARGAASTGVVRAGEKAAATMRMGANGMIMIDGARATALSEDG